MSRILCRLRCVVHSTVSVYSDFYRIAFKYFKSMSPTLSSQRPRLEKHERKDREKERERETEKQKNKVMGRYASY